MMVSLDLEFDVSCIENILNLHPDKAIMFIQDFEQMQHRYAPLAALTLEDVINDVFNAFMYFKHQENNSTFDEVDSFMPDYFRHLSDVVFSGLDCEDTWEEYFETEAERDYFLETFDLGGLCGCVADVFRIIYFALGIDGCNLIYNVLQIEGGDYDLSLFGAPEDITDTLMLDLEYG